MNWFQIVALGALMGIVLADWVRVWRLNSRWVGAGLRSVIWLTACGFILYPDALTAVAKALGIGRGADILLYVVTLAFIAMSFFLYARIVQLRRQMTKLVRHLALLQPHSPETQVTPPCG